MASGGDGLGFFRAPRADTASLDRDEFVRSTAGTEPTRGADASADRGAVAADTDFVRPEPVDTVEHAWVGAGVPLDANKATLDAYHRRLEAGAVEQSRISVLVVCNDEQMREEGEVADLYGLRDMVQFDIEVRHDLTREEMRETLQSDVDFLHYIGHVDDRGMQCTDDYLDPRPRTSTSASAPSCSTPANHTSRARPWSTAAPAAASSPSPTWRTRRRPSSAGSSLA